MSRISKGFDPLARVATTGAAAAAANAGILTRPVPTLSFSSWFCVPEQGMKDMEILNRASAVVVPVRNSSSKCHYCCYLSLYFFAINISMVLTLQASSVNGPSNNTTF
jgi:hypothetical protein